MKKNSLFILIVFSFFIFSCAGTPEETGRKSNEQITKNVVKQPDTPPKKTEEPAVKEQIAPKDLTVTAGEDQAVVETDEPVEKSAEVADESIEEPLNDEIAQEEPAEEPLNSELAQAESGAELSEDAQALSAETETAAVQEPVTEVPVVSQGASEQAQSDQPVQTQLPVQPETPPAQSPPVQPSVEETAAAGETTPSDSDSQPEREASSSAAVSNPIPFTRIESLTQMGTMPYDNEIIFSRIVHAAVGQIVEIPFRGKGWAYIEDVASRRGIAYHSQRNDSDGQSFIFTLEAAGTYVLKFFRRDLIRDYIINDHVQLIVEETQAVSQTNFDRGRVVAQPRWPSAVEEAQISRGARTASEPVVTGNRPAQETAPLQRANAQQRPESVQGTNAQQRPESVQEANAQERTSLQDVPVLSSVNTSGQTAQSTTAVNVEQSGGESSSLENKENLTPEAVMRKARETFDGGNIKAAIELLNQLVADYPDVSDEVYWLLGQYYETNSPARNILLSLDNYRRLVKEYPQSNYFNDARRRIAYLERFYINIQ
jgi:hypothetical protein